MLLPSGSGTAPDNHAVPAGFDDFIRIFRLDLLHGAAIAIAGGILSGAGK